MTTRLHILRPDVPTGPLTRGECREWTEVCALPCRHNIAREHKHAGITRPVPEDVVVKYRGCALNAADEGARGPNEVAALLGVSGTAIGYTVAAGLRALARLPRARRLLGEHDAVGDRVGAMQPNTEGL